MRPATEVHGSRAEAANRLVYHSRILEALDTPSSRSSQVAPAFMMSRCPRLSRSADSGLSRGHWQLLLTSLSCITQSVDVRRHDLETYDECTRKHGNGSSQKPKGRSCSRSDCAPGPPSLTFCLRVQPVPAGRRTRFSSRWSRRKLPSVPAAVSNVACGSPAGCAVSGAHHLLTSRNLVKQISRSNWMREKPQRTVMLSRTARKGSHYRVYGTTAAN
jgi:hypothetical protein